MVLVIGDDGGVDYIDFVGRVFDYIDFDWGLYGDMIVGLVIGGGNLDFRVMGIVLVVVLYLYNIE